MAVKKDGRVIDTLDLYRWPYLIGGPEDGVRVDPKSWDLKEIVVGEEAYLRHRTYYSGAPARITYFIAKLWPRDRFEPYELGRRILDSHPELEKQPDVVINTTTKKDGND
jgi:hypothetical protein